MKYLKLFESNTDKLNEIYDVFNEYKYILEDEGVRTLIRRIRKDGLSNSFLDYPKIKIYLFVEKTDFYKNGSSGNQKRFCKTDCYQEFKDRFFEDIYSKKLSKRDNVHLKHVGDNGIIIYIEPI